MFLKKYKIKNKYLADIETHEVFLDKLAKTREDDSGITEKKLETPLKEKTGYILLAIFLLISVFLFSKIFYWQVPNGDAIRALAENNKGKIVLIKPERGIIYDKNFKKLVLNSPSFDLLCDKGSFPESSEETLKKISEIAKIIEKTPAQILKEIADSDSQFFVAAENISHQATLILEAKKEEFKECKIEENIVRNYVLGPNFSHLIGFTGRINKNELNNLSDYSVSDYIGKAGIEKFYESDLRGIPGKVEFEKTATGIKKGENVKQEAVAGNSLVLNIDFDLQKKIYEELEKGLKNVSSKKGSAVAVDPNTGAILAIVSYPSYDNNLFSKGISQAALDNIQQNPNQPLFNRAISAQYPTGSTIKPFIAGGALQEKIISPDKKINDTGSIEIYSKYDPEIVYTFTGIKPHGWVDIKDALAVSSNIYFYTVGGGYKDQEGLGPSRIKKYLEFFGWGEKTGIDLPGEFKGFIPSPDWKKQAKNENWWDGDTYNLSIGQSDLQITPLQVAMAYSAVANNGILYKPQIAKEIINNNKETPQTIKKFEPEIIRQNFIDKKNLEIIKQGMRDGVTKPFGSSFFLNNLPVEVASKTGTAQISRAGYYNTWVSLFAPYEKPEIVLVITIEEVEGLRSGALSVASEVLKWYFK